MPSIDKVIYFLIRFDRAEGNQVELREFTDNKQAVAAYTAEEEKYVNQPHMDIVLLGSTSIETVQKTHGNYFDSDIDRSSWLDIIGDIDSLTRLTRTEVAQMTCSDANCPPTDYQKPHRPRLRAGSCT